MSALTPKPITPDEVMGGRDHYYEYRVVQFIAVLNDYLQAQVNYDKLRRGQSVEFATWKRTVFCDWTAFCDDVATRFRAAGWDVSVTDEYTGELRKHCKIFSFNPNGN